MIPFLRKRHGCAALLLLAASVGLSQPDHQPLERSATLSFQEILENTLRNAPEALEAMVRQQQAEDYQASGHSWIAGRPSLAMNYFDDRPLDNLGSLELEYGVQLPLWRWGEKAGTLALGERYEDQVVAWQDSLALTLAGRVRTALADIHEAEAMLQVEREVTATAQELLRLTTRMFDAGAVAALDVLQAENLLLEQQQRELQAEAAMVDAELGYSILTGMQQRPAAVLTETLTEAEAVPEQHPLLRYLQSEIAVADANVLQSEISAKGNPQLTLGSRRERGGQSQPYLDSINVSVTIPLGGKSYVSSRSSGARRQKVDAEVVFHNTRRALQVALHEAEHDLFVTREAMPLAQQQLELAERRQQLARLAFEQGEITLTQTLPAVQDAREAARKWQALQLREQRLITEFNQVVGVLP